MSPAETLKLIPTKKNVVVRLFKKEPVLTSNILADVRFELYTMCDVPILTFTFSEPEEIILAALNFRAVACWPDTRTLSIHLQLFDLEKDAVWGEKQILLGPDDTEIILEARVQQRKMKSRQIGAIVDFIYSDYIGFAGLAQFQ
jgi:hypothetical protein